jgi:hypothetical protein
VAAPAVAIVYVDSDGRQNFTEAVFFFEGQASITTLCFVCHTVSSLWSI